MIPETFLPLIQSFVESDDGRAFELFSAIIRRLRAPDGCPWDRKQTLDSLRTYLVEEAFELVSAINENSDEHIAEEIGDLFLVLMLTVSALENRAGTTIHSILQTNAEKLIRRHPHVFGNVEVESEHDVIRNWNKIKADSEGRSTAISAAGKGLPPLLRAFEIQKNAAKHGFDWSSPNPVFDKIREEIDELQEELENQSGFSHDSGEKELGDILFSVVNLSRKLQFDPALALHASTDTFVKRFTIIEDELISRGVSMKDTTLEILDELWDSAKKRLSNDIPQTTD